MKKKFFANRLLLFRNTLLLRYFSPAKQNYRAIAVLSATINLGKEDRFPVPLFSKIIWKVVKGENNEMPAPPMRSAFVKIKAD